jgi:hypothetical protein
MRGEIMANKGFIKNIVNRMMTKKYGEGYDEQTIDFNAEYNIGVFHSKAASGVWSGFGSKATEKVASILGHGAEKAMISKKTGRLAHPAKPGIAKFIPKPINVAKEQAFGRVLGIGQGLELRPVQGLKPLDRKGRGWL